MRLIGRHAIASGSKTTAEIDELSTKFAQKLPANIFTPAQVQNFLQYCRRDADKAVSEVVAWAEEEKSKPSPKPVVDKESQLAHKQDPQNDINQQRARINGILDSLNGETETAARETTNGEKLGKDTAND
jgi:mitochondrial chaperone BCS1